MGCGTWTKNLRKSKEGNLANSKTLHLSRKYRRMEARKDLLGRLDGNEFFMIPTKDGRNFPLILFLWFESTPKRTV